MDISNTRQLSQYLLTATVTKGQSKFPSDSTALCGVCVSFNIIHTALDWNDHPSSTRNDNRRVCPGLQNLSGHCLYLCKLLRRNEVLWPHAFSSNNWIGAVSLPTQVLLWCRYKWNPPGSSSYTTMKENNCSNFSGSLVPCQEAAQTETSQVY